MRRIHFMFYPALLIAALFILGFILSHSFFIVPVMFLVKILFVVCAAAVVAFLLHMAGR